MPDLSNYQVDHLILLVGQNPLPNAVAGKLLVRPKGTVTLVHSESVRFAAQRLAAWLKHETDCHPKFQPIKESSPDNVVRGLQSVLKSAQTDSIGLNYTGGTKVMSTHAYRTVERWAKKKQATPVFSYLDAHSLSMVFTHMVEEDEQEVEQWIPVALEVEPTLVELMEFHGRKPKGTPNSKPVLIDTAQKLASAFTGYGFHIWKNWTKDWLRKCCWDYKTNDWRQRLNGVEILFPQRREIASVIESLKADLKITSDKLSLTQPEFPGTAQEFCGWLDGKWLEHYVLDILLSLQGKLDLRECVQNIETQGVRFEVDVITLRGYQLFAFSCTTMSEKSDSRGELKRKLFEAYIRARQLGGDEARVAYVTCADDPDGLQDEIERDVDQEGRIKVFGRQDLSNLKALIQTWMEGQIRESRP